MEKIHASLASLILLVSSPDHTRSEVMVMLHRLLDSPRAG